MTLSTLLQGYHAGGGTLSGDALSRSADEIWRMMLGESRGRIVKAEETGPEAQLIQQCFSQMVDAGAAQPQASLAGETLGQWSRSYRDPEKSRERMLLSMMRQYLGETGLLYRGWTA